MNYINAFKVIGISIETTNINYKAAEDLSRLWSKFYKDNIPAKIPNKSGDEIYVIYTDYESDYTGKYTAIIGLKVSTLLDVPNGLTGREFNAGTYKKFHVEGKLPDALVKIWQEIWAKDTNLYRKYSADFEVYGQAAQNPENAEVDLFIAVD